MALGERIGRKSHCRSRRVLSRLQYVRLIGHTIDEEFLLTGVELRPILAHAIQWQGSPRGARHAARIGARLAIWAVVKLLALLRRENERLRARITSYLLAKLLITHDGWLVIVCGSGICHHYWVLLHGDIVQEEVSLVEAWDNFCILASKRLAHCLSNAHS